MFAREIKRLAFCIGPALILLYVGFSLYRDSDAITTQVKDWIEPALAKSFADKDVELLPEQATISSLPEPEAADASESVQITPPASQDASHISDDKGPPLEPLDTSRQELFSLSTPDKKYFLIDLDEMHGMNPNIIPHPTLDDTWIIVAQQAQPGKSTLFTELVCNAVLRDGALRCLQPPTVLPIAATKGDRCEGDLAHFNINVGPHDARVFYGPDKPYVVYGSNSAFTCFGQFIQDFRVLDVGMVDQPGSADFGSGTELQRPLLWGAVEKNWFMFWDAEGQMYAHYDIAPKRVFAQISSDGSVGSDLAPIAAASDEKCWNKYTPKLASELESVHQATNSLLVTMCRRTEPSCVADQSNTFLFTIYQHKSYYDFHSVYEPYIMMFQQRAPFEIHAMSQRPLWINGREQHADRNTSDMFYVTSMSWKKKGQRYHGYLDDEVFVAFGIEDERAAGIDVLASDLLEGLGLCSES
ncbi:hypothetical protein G7046_g5590 [Stylonectria norvegica]|nr:hypothetical protein G7046_g5590 [Stylonectria norvegica]